MERQRENIMGTMPEGRLLFKLALPMILSVLVSSLYNIVDSIFVGGGAPPCGMNALLSRKLGEKGGEGVSKTAGQASC